MLDLRRLSIHQVTLLRQCTTPQFVAALTRNGVPCTSLWRDKTLEYGVEKTARIVADNGIALSGYCFAGLITSPDRASLMVKAWLASNMAASPTPKLSK